MSLSSNHRRDGSASWRGAGLIVVALLAMLALVAAPSAIVLLAAYAILLAVLAAAGVVFLRAREPGDDEQRPARTPLSG